MDRRRFLIRSASRSMAAAAAVLLSGGLAAAQPATTSPGPATRAEVVEAIVSVMKQRYVFPHLVPKVQAALADPARTRAIDAAADPAAFAAELTGLLQAVASDRHLRVRYSEAALPEGFGQGRPGNEDRARFEAEAQQRNFGVERVERLPGNIGYIELRGFMPLELAGEAIAAAMTLVAHSQALIVDLRRNGGGDPRTVALASSYLFDQPTHLNNLYWREGDRTQEFWTQADVKGQRFGGTKPVYVLTSSRTFSGAEEFSYNLRNLKRATLIGEVTGGGANPGGMQRLSAHYSMFVSTGRAISPVTGTNWEGTGVEPHVPVAADDALLIAQLRALAPLAGATKEPGLLKELQARIAELEAAAPAGR